MSMLYSYWRLAHGVQGKKIPSYLREWLYDPGSMTHRLEQLSNPAPLTVQVLTQAWLPLNLTESKLLKMSKHRNALVREVILGCNNQAWIFARSIFPATTLTGKTKRLAYELDNRPLGKLLFRHPDLRRSEFEFAQLRFSHWEYQYCQRFLPPLQSENLWARRSVFFLKDKPILVMEIFLPGLIQNINDSSTKKLLI